MQQPGIASSVGGDREARWRHVWNGLRIRRIAAFASIAVFAVGSVFGSGVVLAIATLAPVVAFYMVRSWRCPRCHETFVGARLNWFGDECATCNLPAFAPVERIDDSSFSHSANTFALDPSLRKFVAVSQMVGGALILVMELLAGGARAGNFVAMGLGLAGVLAGALLWRDDPRAYSASRLLQGLQVLKLQVPPVFYAVSVGFHVLVLRGNVSGIEAGISGNFQIGAIRNAPVVVGVNVLALVCFLILLRARPVASDKPAG
jgi:hypothetical protein